MRWLCYKSLLATVLLSLRANSHANHDQAPLTGTHSTYTRGGGNEWSEKYGPQIDQPFSGPLSFSHLPYARCLEDASAQFDIAVLGMPFDTGVSYRPGARFGPYGIRSGSRRQRETRGWTLSWQVNPYTLGSRIIDCGDVCTSHNEAVPPQADILQVPVNPYDNALAVDQMEVAYSTLLARPVSEPADDAISYTRELAIDGLEHPRIVRYGNLRMLKLKS